MEAHEQQNPTTESPTRRELVVITPGVCKGCGACCRHMGHPVFLRYGGPQLHAEEGWLNLPEPLKSEIDAYLARLMEERDKGLRGHAGDYGEPCIWLEPSGACRHYEYRPWVCRDFERDGEDCLRIRQKVGISAEEK